MLIYTSNKSVKEIDLVFEKETINVGMGLLKTYNYAEMVADKGFPIEGDVMVYEICQAKIASKVLTTNRDFAPFMPCRISVYDNNGKTMITSPNMEEFIDNFDDSVKSDAQELFDGLKKLLENLAN